MLATIITFFGLKFQMHFLDTEIYMVSHEFATQVWTAKDQTKNFEFAVKLQSLEPSICCHQHWRETVSSVKATHT